MYKNLRSGDLLLFDGESNTSQLIKFFTVSCWSHVALVYRCPKTKILYVWENGDVGRGSGPLITRKGCPRNSAHLIPLKSRLKAYKGLVYVRRLLGKKSIDHKVYDKFVAENLGTDYSWDLVASWNQRGGSSLLPLCFLEDKNDRYGGWICSQLVALTYKQLGVMELLQASHTFMPVDFAKDDIVDNESFILTDPELIHNSVDK